MRNSQVEVVSWGFKKNSCLRSGLIAVILSVSFSSAFGQNPPPPNPDPEAAGHPPTLKPTPLPDNPRPQPQGTLTLGQRAALEAHTTFGISAFVVPAGDALVDMADPRNKYPKEWLDGGQAFGRNYGAEFARHTAGGATHLVVAVIDREDPRYYFSTSHGYIPRAAYALLFTVFDQSNSGHRTLALSNIAGAAGAGAVGMAFYPDGYRDITHAYQRAAVETTTFASHNLIAEFSPEIVHVLRAIHVPDKLASALLPPDTPKP